MGVKSSILPSGVGLIEVKGPLLSDEEVNGLRKATSEAIDRQCQRLLMDFTDVSYINSSAIGVMVSAHTSYSKRSWQLKFCNLNRSVHLVLAITNLNKVFTVCETREEALQSFA